MGTRRRLSRRWWARTGNVVQLRFVAPTDLSNFIASDLANSVAAWRDASTALFLVGYSPSTVAVGSVFDACDALTTSWAPILGPTTRT